jgi:alkanesulfonate monooxygenase SsuD/methylene tetrahydromethanopterin reductase-like flavin-dependent oxidoreductase (luciferase family)
MDFYMLHLMPYYHGIERELRDAETAWVTFPNRHYDSNIGHRLYNRYLDELEMCERLGFDGVCVNEHHQTAYGTMPAPNIMAACLARRTHTMKIALLGNAIGMHGHPTRVAEEVAMLDVVTGGRIISGFVRGIGDEYSSLNVDPSLSRERFDEAYELIVKAWTTGEPFAWIGKHWNYRYVNVWPQPLQKPHPPIWVPGAGSPETFRWVAEHRYTWMSVFMPYATVKAWVAQFHRVAEDVYAYTLDIGQIAHAVPLYVAETDKQAHAEARAHIEWLYHLGLKRKWQRFMPPGYISTSAMRNLLARGHRPYSDYSYEELVSEGCVVVGSTKTIIETLERYQQELGVGVLVPLLQIGDMPHHRAVKNIEMFASEVIPYFKSAAASVAAPT